MIQSAPRFRVLHSAQEQEWNDVLAQVVRRDFYHLAEYHRIAEERGEGSAHLFAYHDGAYTIALPLLLRPVEASGGEAWRDATSVYGYAGPLASHAGMPAARASGRRHRRIGAGSHRTRTYESRCVRGRHGEARSIPTSALGVRRQPR